MSKLLKQLRPAVAWGIAIIIISTMMAMAVEWRAPWLGQQTRDALMRARGTLTPPAEITIVAIDDASIARFGRFPWPRALMAQTLRKLSAARPAVIGISVLYSDPTTEQDDQALIAAIKDAGNVVTAAQLISNGQGRAEWLRPLPAIEQAAAGTGHGNVITDYDGIARAVPLREADDEGRTLWSLAAEVVRVGDGAAAGEIHDVPDAVRIAARTIPVAAESATVMIAAKDGSAPPEIFRADRMTTDFAGPAGSYAARTFSIADVLDDRIRPDELRGKYLLIGATATAMSDRVASPFARHVSNEGNRNGPNGTLMPGVEVLANAVTTILHKRFYAETADWLAVLIAALVATAVIFSLTISEGRLQTFKQIAAIAALGVLILLAAYLLFAHARIVAPLVPSLVSLIVATPLTLLRRTIAASTELDKQIRELMWESAKLSTTAISSNDEPSPPVWFLPHGMSWKARMLNSLQRRLVARAQFVDRALRSVEDGLMIADAQGRIIFANPRAAQILGVVEPSLLGSNLFDRLHAAEYGSSAFDENRLKRFVTETLSRLLIDRASMERELTVNNGQINHYALRITSVFGFDARELPLGVIATLADITQQRELRQMQTDVMALVTHEMKTPLTAIQGLSEVLMKFDAAPEKRREMHGAINEAAQRMRRMIDEYLDLTRLESGTHPLRQTFIRPTGLLEQNLQLLDLIAAQRGIRLTRSFASDLPVIQADADLLSRAITNLVVNAIKYSPANSEVTISAKVENKSVLFSVSDQGYGIPPEHQTHIFEKFYRIPRVEDADTPGAGLGLAMVREIAEMHGGRVTVESKIDHGSTFRLMIPLGETK